MANKLFSFKILEQIYTVPGITFIASHMIDQPKDEHSDAMSVLESTYYE